MGGARGGTPSRAGLDAPPVGSSGPEAASRADVVPTSLADDAAVEAVYLDPGGIVEGIGPTAVAIEASTVDPRTVEAIGSAGDGTGAGVLDCPVSGRGRMGGAGRLP